MTSLCGVVADWFVKKEYLQSVVKNKYIVCIFISFPTF